MSVVVFAGPSIPAAEIVARLDAQVLPPAAVGDVLRVARQHPTAIGLVDGVFDGSLPVWHKEILWAMAEGVHVFGAASMGALRAAELDQFGMRGVGEIYAAYRDGTIDADDEVAVLHGPPEVGFAAVTEALVNVRASLERAVGEGVLTGGEAAVVLKQAGDTHYRERTWDALLAGLEGSLAGRLHAWLPTGRVDRKREDARALVSAMEAFLRADPPPMVVEYRFAWTDAWDALYSRVTAGTDANDLLDEVRLQIDLFATIQRAALLRAAVAHEAERQGLAIPRAQEATERLRSRLGLWRRADLDRWLAANDLDDAGFAALAVEDMLISWLAERGARDAAMLAELRLRGGYPAIACRAREKAATLSAAGFEDMSAKAAGIDLGSVLGALAAKIDGPAADLPRRLGFRDQQALERALLREHGFARIVRDNRGAIHHPGAARPDSD